MYIFIDVKTHKFFERDGRDIFIQVPVSTLDAILGCDIFVPCIDGKKAKLSIISGTQTGTRLRMKGKGMPSLRGGSNGDQYVEIVLETPVNISKKQQDLIKEFINIDISKQFQSSDFGGELSPAQLKYCANDVIYLHKIHDELYKILERENRVKLYEECLKFVKTRVQLDLSEFKDDIWSH